MWEDWYGHRPRQMDNNDELMKRHRERGFTVPKDLDDVPSPVTPFKGDHHGGLAVVLGVRGWGYLLFSLRGVAILTDEEVKFK